MASNVKLCKNCKYAIGEGIFFKDYTWAKCSKNPDEYPEHTSNVSGKTTEAFKVNKPCITNRAFSSDSGYCGPAT